MKVNEALIISQQSLKAVGISTFYLDSQLLLAFVLKMSREELFFKQQQDLTINQFDEFIELLQRREKREPVSHIIGKRGFWTEEFKVTKDVLDPRNDSETIIESVIKLFPNRDEPLKVLDLGTGSGCLLLIILMEYSKAIGLGIDISDEALRVARENARNLELVDRVIFRKNNWGRGLEEQYDLVISNPPYIPASQIEKLQDEVKIYEPRLALDGGADGLNCYRDIAQDIGKLLAVDGILVLEIGRGQEEDVKDIFEKAGLKFVSFKKDLAEIVRCVIMKN